MGSWIKLVVGKVYTPTGFRDSYGDHLPPQPFFIKKEVTQKEWEDSVYTVSGIKPLSDFSGYKAPLYFYEVETD